MQWLCKSSTKMELKWSLVSMAIFRNTKSTSKAIDFTSKSAQSAWFSIVFATKCLRAWTESRRATRTSALIQTVTLLIDFFSGQAVMYWAVLSRKFIPIIFLDCLTVLAITQLYQHILEAWRTCREAWGCLFGDRNIMTFWLEMVDLSWSADPAHGLSYLTNLGLD